MILRKPYAFLIKNFKKINLLLLILVIFILWRNFSLYGFIRDYIETGVYNVQIDSISNYINLYLYTGLGAMVVISSILGYLLKYKDKPYISYLVILIIYLIEVILFAYIHYYFTISITSEFNLANAMMLRDISFIMTIPHYPILFLLLIRAIGIDLKRFGFGEDREFINVGEEDREEVEVEITFNKDRWIRQFKNKCRMLKYFFLEHRLPIIVVFLLVLSLGSYNIYHYVFVENKVYTIGESFKSGNFVIGLNNTYITNKDYIGNIITKDKYYFLLEITLENTTTENQKLNMDDFYLYVDNDYYIPTERFNKHFVDMGTIYTKEKEIKPGKVEKVILVYEITPPSEDTNFLLTYQNVNYGEKVKRIKVQVRDISSFVEKDRKQLTETLEVPLNLEKKWSFRIPSYQITDSINYRYEACNTYTCPIYEGTLTSNTGKSILYLKLNYDDGSRKDFLSFLETYGKIRYQINGTTYETKINYQITNYRGDHAYIELPEIVKNAEKIELCFTVRTYQYFYTLKGE